MMPERRDTVVHTSEHGDRDTPDATVDVTAEQQFGGCGRSAQHFAPRRRLPRPGVQWCGLVPEVMNKSARILQPIGPDQTAARSLSSESYADRPWFDHYISRRRG